MDLTLYSQLLLNGLMSGGMYALVASGLTLTLGVIKIFNFAQGQFYMLGAFLTFAAVETLGFPYPIAILASLLCMGILGVLFYFGMIQKTMSQGFFGTMLVSVLFANIINQVSIFTFAYKDQVLSPIFSSVLNFGEVRISTGKLVVIGCAIIIMVLLHFFMQTKIGTAMMASAENSDVAKLQGINTRKIFWVTMAVGCGLSGIAGSIILPVTGAYLMMGPNIFMRALLVLMLGGMGSMTGALIAGFLIGIVESIAFQYVGYLNLIAILIFVGIVMFFRPGGLLGKPMPIPGE
jgi:branched-chain amino acid transport system permease protein